MTVQVAKLRGRDALERPYLSDFEDSERRRAENVRMPKTLPALLHWFAKAMSDEIPSTIHREGVWADHTKRATVRQDGQVAHVDCGREACETPHFPRGTGGSLIGSPDEAGGFRAYMYGSPSQTDEEGSYLRPLHRAISELDRSGRPLMARMLFGLAASGYDWKAIAERGHWAEEQFADYLEWSLRKLWTLTIARDERQVRAA